jgi:hypothetical protein
VVNKNQTQHRLYQGGGGQALQATATIRMARMQVLIPAPEFSGEDEESFEGLDSTYPDSLEPLLIPTRRGFVFGPGQIQGG